MPETEEVQIPEGAVSEAEVINGIREIAYSSATDNTRLRAWELLGKINGLFRDGASDGGAPVIRLTPPLSGSREAVEEAGDDRQ